MRRGCRRYLEVEHAGLVRGLDRRVLGTLLEQSVELYHHSQYHVSPLDSKLLLSYLEELVIRGLGLELTAVLDGLLELGGLGDHFDGLVLYRKRWFGVKCELVDGRRKRRSE